jgi:hypothetical protein
MRVARRSPQHPVFGIDRNGRCSCVCGCSHVLSRHEMDETGDWCGACYYERGHAPTRQGSARSFDTDPTPPHGIRRPTTGDNQ